MRRRTFLATAGTAVALPLAGCAHPTSGSLSMHAMDDDTVIADRYAGETEGLPPERRALLDAAIAGESPTREGLHPPYESDRPVEYEGSYYAITAEVVATHTEMLYDVRIDYDPATQPSSVIDYASLPTADKNALGELIPPDEDVPESEGYDIGRTYRYPEDPSSVLVDGQYDGVRHASGTYRVTVEPNREVTVETYEYAAEKVADSASALGRQLRTEYGFTLDGLSEDEQTIVEQAIGDSYYPEDATDAFRSLVDRFRAHDAVDSDEYGGDWLVRYDGTLYWADLRYPPETDA